MSGETRRDLVGSAVLLVVAAVFWSQQDYSTPSDGYFPRFVLVVLALLALAIGVPALLRARRSAPASAEPGREEATERPAPDTTEADAPTPTDTDTEPEPARPTSRPEWWALPAAAGVLFAWGVAFGLFGVTLSGVVAFVVTAVLIRRGIGSRRQLLLDIGVALVLVVFCFLVFTRVLQVPLPVSVLLGV